MLTEEQVTQLLGDGDLERVRQIGDFAPAGEGGERISAGEVERVEPGAYVDLEERMAAAFLACDEGGPLPRLLHATVEPAPTESGEQWTDEQLLSVAERLAEMTRRAYECPGGISALGPEEEQALSETYRELTEG